MPDPVSKKTLKPTQESSRKIPAQTVSTILKALICFGSYSNYNRVSVLMI